MRHIIISCALMLVKRFLALFSLFFAKAKEGQKKSDRRARTVDQNVPQGGSAPDGKPLDQHFIQQCRHREVGEKGRYYAPLPRSPFFPRQGAKNAEDGIFGKVRELTQEQFADVERRKTSSDQRLQKIAQSVAQFSGMLARLKGQAPDHRRPEDG